MNTNEIQQQIAYLNQELNNLENIINEQIKEKETNKTLLQDIKQLKNLKENQELIVPISKGIFIKLKIKEFNDFIVNIGNNVMVEKKLGDVQELLKENISIIEENITILQQQEKKLIDTLQKIHQQTKKLKE